MKKILLALLVTVMTASGLRAQQKTEPLKEPAFNKIENKIIDTIANLAEVKERAGYVEKQSRGKRHLVYTIYQKPVKAIPYYWIKVWEDNGSAYVTHFNFYVYPKTFLIKYLDTANDKVIDLETWREKRND